MRRLAILLCTIGLLPVYGQGQKSLDRLSYEMAVISGDSSDPHYDVS